MSFLSQHIEAKQTHHVAALLYYRALLSSTVLRAEDHVLGWSKVLSGFSVECYGKNPNDLFGQPKYFSPNLS